MWDSATEQVSAALDHLMMMKMMVMMKVMRWIRVVEIKTEIEKIVVFRMMMIK